MLDRDVPESEGQDGAGDGKKGGGAVFQRAQREGDAHEGAVDEEKKRQAADGQADEIERQGRMASQRRLDDDGRRRPADRPAQDQQDVGNLVQRDPGVNAAADPAQQDHQRQAGESDDRAEQPSGRERLAQKAHGQQQGDQRVQGDEQRGGVGLDVAHSRVQHQVVADHHQQAAQRHAPGMRFPYRPRLVAVEQGDQAQADHGHRDEAQAQQVESGHPRQQQLDGDERVGPDEEGQDQQGKNADVARSIFQKASAVFPAIGTVAQAGIVDRLRLPVKSPPSIRFPRFRIDNKPEKT